MSQELPHLLFRMTVSGSAVRPVALTKVFNWAELCATVMATACDSHHFILIKPLSDPLYPCVEASAFIKHSQWRDISHLAEVVIKRLSAHLRQTHWISVRATSSSGPVLSGCLGSLSYKTQDQDLILCYCWKFIFSLMCKRQNQQWQFNFPRSSTVQPLLNLNHTHLLISVSTHRGKLVPKAVCTASLWPWHDCLWGTLI